MNPNPSATPTATYLYLDPYRYRDRYLPLPPPLPLPLGNDELGAVSAVLRQTIGAAPADVLALRTDNQTRLFYVGPMGLAQPPPYP